eukprot:416935-Pyramimonas_sp.AAC.1
MDQSDAGSAGIFSQWTNQTQETRVYSHDGPITFPGRGVQLRVRARHLSGGGGKVCGPLLPAAAVR